MGILLKQTDLSNWMLSIFATLNSFAANTGEDRPHPQVTLVDDNELSWHLLIN